MEHFRASEVLCDSDDETHGVQWLWPYGGIDFEQGYFVLERAVEPDDADSETVWASRCSQGYSCYRGIDHVTLHRNEVIISLNQRGKEQLACDDLLIEFELDELGFARLTEVLSLVFDGLNQLFLEFLPAK